MTEQNVFQQSPTSSDRVLSWANLFCTVTLYCCWSVLSSIRRGMSKMLEESGFFLGFNKVRHNSATCTTWSVFAGAFAPQNVLYDLKSPLSLSRVMMWSDSFLVEPS